jgi:hypothetical protein
MSEPTDTTTVAYRVIGLNCSPETILHTLLYHRRPEWRPRTMRAYACADGYGVVCIDGDRGCTVTRHSWGAVMVHGDGQQVATAHLVADGIAGSVGRVRAMNGAELAAEEREERARCEQ